MLADGLDSGPVLIDLVDDIASDFQHHQSEARYDENDGDVALVKATPDGFNPTSSFKITKGKGKFWAHPSISDGRLYIRHGEYMMVYDIKER